MRQGCITAKADQHPDRDYDSSTAVSAKVNQSASDTADIKLTQNTSDKENLATAEDLHKVYLTFDDGPSDNTNAILDVLDDYNVKATFFVTGKEDEASKAPTSVS